MMRYLAAFLFLIGIVCLFHDVPRAQVPLTHAGRGAAGTSSGGGSSTCATIIGQVTGVISCWNADEGVTGNPSVTAWTDQATGFVLGLHTSGAEPSPTSPTFSSTSYGGKAGLTFTAASGNYLANTLAVNSAYGGLSNLSVFAAATLTSNAVSFARLFSYTSASTDTASDGVAAILRNSTTQAIEAFQNGSAAGSYSITYGSTSRFGVTIGGSTINTYLNNVFQATGSGGSSLSLGGTGQLCLGDCSGGSSAFWDGIVRRIVVTSTVVSSTDRSNIDTWLQQ